MFFSLSLLLSFLFSFLFTRMQYRTLIHAQGSAGFVLFFFFLSIYTHAVPSADRLVLHLLHQGTHRIFYTRGRTELFSFVSFSFLFFFSFLFYLQYQVQIYYATGRAGFFPFFFTFLFLFYLKYQVWICYATGRAELFSLVSFFLCFSFFSLFLYQVRIYYATGRAGFFSVAGRTRLSARLVLGKVTACSERVRQ